MILKAINAVIYICRGEIYNTIYYKLHEKDYSELLVKEIEQLQNGNVCDVETYSRILYKVTRRSNIKYIADCIANVIVKVEKIKKTNSCDKYGLIEKDINQLNDIIAGVNYKNMSYIQWKRLMHILLNCSFIQAAYICRKKMADHIEKDLFRRYEFEKLYLYIERAEYDKARILVDKSYYFKLVKCLRPQLYKDINNTIAVLSKEPYKDNLQPNDRKYKDFINNKTIAIVGPGIIEDKKSIYEEIDNFDLVIYITYKNTEEQNRLLGNRAINITYYNCGNFESLKENRWLDTAKDVKFICTKSSNDLNKASNRKDCIVRSVISDGGVALRSYSGSAFMQPYILYDLMHFNPNDVKIYNTNLYLTKQIYDKSYGFTVDYRAYLNAFYIHDIYYNYCVLRNMINCFDVDMDEHLKYVVNLGVDKYIQEMEKEYMTKILG